MRECEYCGQWFHFDDRRANSKRYCSRRCQTNAYHDNRKRTDPAFHAQALEYQRLWRVRQRSRRQQLFLEVFE